MIKFLDLQKINLTHQQEIEERLLQTFRSGWYLLGNEVKNFEHNVRSYLGAEEVIGVANGLDALRLILRGYIEMGVKYIISDMTYFSDDGHLDNYGNSKEIKHFFSKKTVQ